MTDSNLEKSEKKDTVPAEQAAQAVERAKKVWGGFLKSEKIIVIGALVLLIGFFLPWIGGEEIELMRKMNMPTSGFAIADYNNWLFSIPLLMLISLGLVYFTQGASNIAKILIARWQIIIGTIFSTIGIIGIISLQSIINAVESIIINAVGGGLFRQGDIGIDDIGIEIGIGWWLLTLGAIAILVGALMTQEKLLKK